LVAKPLATIGKSKYWAHHSIGGVSRNYWAGVGSTKTVPERLMTATELDQFPIYHHA
jgi:hypothetical protein